MATVHMMVGIPGSGKSYYSNYLNKLYGYHIISTDRVRILTNVNGKNKVYYISVVDNDNLISVIAPKSKQAEVVEEKAEEPAKKVAAKKTTTKKTTTKTTTAKKTSTKKSSK